jgi:PBSX family phage terminase large subunit
MPREHALNSIKSTKWLNIWEGSVRSSKTLMSILAWLMFIEESPDFVFGMSGNTINSLYNNCIGGQYGILAIHPGSYYRASSAPSLFIPTMSGLKRCVLYGACNTNSHDKVVGLTAGGWYFDELNKHHKNFIVEAQNRTLASPTRKLFATMNPDNPNKELYSDFVDRWRLATPEERKKAGGVNYYHFTMADNPIMTPDMISTFAVQYKGFEYDRYILGKRVSAEGLVYPGVSMHNVFYDFPIEDVEVTHCAIDWGTDHPTAMLFGGMARERNNGNLTGHTIRTDWRIVREIYDKRKDKIETDIVYRFEAECKDMNIDPHNIRIAIDPSARALKNAFLRAGYGAVDSKVIAGVESANNVVIEGIRFHKHAMYNGFMHYHKSCVNSLREFGSYSWDERASLRGEEKPIKINDDCTDAGRYFSNTFIRPTLGGMARA